VPAAPQEEPEPKEDPDIDKALREIEYFLLSKRKCQHLLRKNPSLKKTLTLISTSLGRTQGY
jgi:hypothetical protein